MSKQDFKPILSIYDYLLYVNLYFIYRLPCGNDPQALADQTCTILTGKCLLKQDKDNNLHYRETLIYSYPSELDKLGDSEPGKIEIDLESDIKHIIAVYFIK